MKLGQTHDPYERRNGYRTASMPDDHSSFKFLIKIKKQKKKIHRKIEEAWIGKFQKSISTPASKNNNVLFSVETIVFKTMYEVIDGFRTVLRDLKLEDIFVGAYLNDAEIINVFNEYERLYEESTDSSDSDTKSQPEQPVSYSGWALRPYQLEDICNTVEQFTGKSALVSGSVSRLYLDIACGLGKTLIGYEIL
jgi:hypothetical protein